MQLSCRIKLKATQNEKETLTIQVTVNGTNLGEKSFQGDSASNDMIVKDWLTRCFCSLSSEESQNTTAANTLYQTLTDTINSPEWGTIERYRGIERQVDIQLN